MKEIRTEITINSRPEKVWHVLMDFKGHAHWNPFIKSIKGSRKVGGLLTVSVQPPDGKDLTFRPIVVKNEKNKEFSWLGKLWFRGLFDGEHYFILKENDNGSTTLIHGERFSGLLVWFLRNSFQKTKSGFEIMNNAIKLQSEKVLMAA